MNKNSENFPSKKAKTPSLLLQKIQLFFKKIFEKISPVINTNDTSTIIFDKEKGLNLVLQKISMFSKKIFEFFNPPINSFARIDQLRYLSQTALIEETTAPRIVRIILMITSAIIIALLIWSSLTYVNEIAVAEGEVLPSSHIQSIQHLEGGIVSEINVFEGALVEKGQTLIKLNKSGLEQDLASLKAKKTSLQYKYLTLKAFINQTTPTFKEITDGKNKEIENEQSNAFQSMIKAKETSKKIIQEQLNQKRESLGELENKRITLQENAKLVSEERDLKKRLMDKGNLSKFNFLDIQKQLNDIRGELNSVESEISQAKNIITEYQNRLNSLDANSIDDAYRELSQVTTDLAQTDEMINKLSNQIERLDIKSPTYGYVKGLKVKTIGGVVEAGKIILEIVPLDGDLVVEAKIQPRDVGHVKIGQEVKVKVSSYDYTRYGTVSGKLEYISATTFINDDNTRYYLGKISLEKNYVGQDSTKNLIMPGMTVEAGIVTGHKTILSYLLKPIHTSVSSAFTER